MGDLVTSITGGGGTQAQTTKVDPTTQALNNLRLQYSRNVLGAGGGGFQFAGPNAAYQPSPYVNDLYNMGMTGYANNVPYNTLDYASLGTNSLLGNANNAAQIQQAAYGQGL